MSVRFQLVINCAEPEPLARFWAAALDYELEPPPAGFTRWIDYWRDLGVDESELDDSVDSIVDPTGQGPRIWFHIVPDSKTVTNRLHIDIGVSGGRSVPLDVRKQRVDAEAQRLAALGATIFGPLDVGNLDHYAVGMKDPEGNEFDIN